MASCSNRPVDRQAVIAGLRAMPQAPLVTYLRHCTNADDRVLHVGYAPETDFFARRGSADGHVVSEGAYYFSPEGQSLTVSRVQRERVPVTAERGRAGAPTS